MKFAVAVVILFVAFAVLSGIQIAIQTVDVTTLPEEYLWFYNAIAYVFTTSAATMLFTFARNIFGYVENYLESTPTQRQMLNYEAGQLGATWAKYQAMIMSFTVAIQAFSVGTPYEIAAVYIAGAIAFIIDLITKKLADIAKA